MEGEFHGVSRRRSRNGGVVEASSRFLVVFLVFVFIFAEFICLGLQLLGLLVEFCSIANAPMAIGLDCDFFVLHTWEYCTNLSLKTSDRVREIR